MKKNIIYNNSLAKIKNGKHCSYQILKREWEAFIIESALLANELNVAKTADKLGMKAPDLHRKIRMLGIKKEDYITTKK